MTGRDGPVVTVDGPAGSGKSTTAREVARRLGFRHLDSGALYRAVTLALLQRGMSPDRWGSLGPDDFRALEVDMVPLDDGFEVRIAGVVVGPELRTRQVTGHVSHLARIPAARACLLELQRQAGRAGRLVADGRDMGSVVFPDADLKVFLVADLEERARRRLAEGGEDDPTAAEMRTEAEGIAERDRLDSERAASPLVKPDGAWELDTTGLSFEDQVEAVVQRVNRLTQD